MLRPNFWLSVLSVYLGSELTLVFFFKHSHFYLCIHSILYLLPYFQAIAFYYSEEQITPFRYNSA